MKKTAIRIKRKIQASKRVKIPSRLPLIIPDNKHYLEFLVSRAGKQRVPGRVCRSRCAGNNYQRRSAAFVPLSPQRQLVGFGRFSGQRPHQPFLTFRPALSDIQPIYPPSLRRLFRACSLALSGRNKAISRRVYPVFIRAGLKVNAGRSGSRSGLSPLLSPPCHHFFRQPCPSIRLKQQAF